VAEDGSLEARRYSLGSRQIVALGFGDLVDCNSRIRRARSHSLLHIFIHCHYSIHCYSPLVAGRTLGELSLESATVHAEAASGSGDAAAVFREHALYVFVFQPLNR